MTGSEKDCEISYYNDMSKLTQLVLWLATAELGTCQHSLIRVLLEFKQNYAMVTR